jgi:hypothetical protein
MRRSFSITIIYHNMTWFSPPCQIANKIAPASLKLIEKFVTADRELGRPANDFANLADALFAILALSSGTDYQRTDVALLTMAQAHAAKNGIQTASAAMQGTYWTNGRSWLTNRPSRWTSDGQWRW